MEFLIITGLSGAGKSRAADVLEDLDYYCVDNMPVALIPRFAELCLNAHGRYDKVALVTDVRERDGFGELLNTLEELKAMDCTVRILYMDADLRTLVRRYKESRRPHPLQHECKSVEQAVRLEASRLGWLRDRADYETGQQTEKNAGMIGAGTAAGFCKEDEGGGENQKRKKRNHDCREHCSF